MSSAVVVLLKSMRCSLLRLSVDSDYLMHKKSMHQRKAVIETFARVAQK
jgi:hypothetical protein